METEYISLFYCSHNAILGQSAEIVSHSKARHDDEGAFLLTRKQLDELIMKYIQQSECT